MARTIIKKKRKRVFYVKKPCRFCEGKLPRIDYKDVNNLRQFVTDRGKMLSRRITGTCAKHQRQLSRAIKKARYIALLPYVSE
ncbi:MAG: 30S ribosomal protein S18 [Candidatus Euphemobacter frigidus]|nr:30S ribosomal protein S18 [Candidatus Euphemobacter frigidus]MDP8275912.1 30S ribosomal protein S18 [Candidatus Euphemobacter frigidus]